MSEQKPIQSKTKIKEERASYEQALADLQVEDPSEEDAKRILEENKKDEVKKK